MDEIILKSFKLSFRSLLERFKNQDFTTKSIKESESELAFFMEFIKLQSRPEGFAILKDDHFKAFEDSLLKIQEILIKHFSSLQTEYTEALEELKFKRVKDLLLYSKEIEKVFVPSLEKHMSEDPSQLVGFKEVMNQIWTYKKMHQMLLDRISEIAGEITATNLLDLEKLNSEGDYKIFYENLSLKLLKLLEIQDYKELELETKPIYDVLTEELLKKKSFAYDMAKIALEELLASAKKSLDEVEIECYKFMIHYHCLSSFEKFLVFHRSKAGSFNLLSLVGEVERGLNNLTNAFIESFDSVELWKAKEIFEILQRHFEGIALLHDKSVAKLTEIENMIQCLVG